MIRKAKKSDIENILKLIKVGSQGGKVLLRSTDEVSRGIDRFFVFCEDHTIAGCCSLDIYSQKLAEIRSLVVLPDYRNRGIGSKLIARCLEKAKRLGIYQVLAVTDCDKLFANMGFAAKLKDKQPMFINLDGNYVVGGDY